MPDGPASAGVLRRTTNDCCGRRVFLSGPHPSVDDRGRIGRRDGYAWGLSASGFGGMASLSRHRPCVASAWAGRSHEKWLPSKAGASGVLVLVWEPTWPPRTIDQPLLPRLWPVRQPPVRRPSRDSNVCIFGPSRNDRAGCAQVVRWSEQSLTKSVPYQLPLRQRGRIVNFRQGLIFDLPPEAGSHGSGRGSSNGTANGKSRLTDQWVWDGSPTARFGHFSRSAGSQTNQRVVLRWLVVRAADRVMCSGSQYRSF